jgi:RNA polymerase sigma factor (sigma-70 family)
MPPDAPEIPNLIALRANDGAAWEAAYPLLWDAGIKVACINLGGGQHSQNREDLVADALSQLQQGMVRGDGKDPNLFKQIAAWRDLVSMMCLITERRIADFLRKKYRRGEEIHADPTLAEDAIPVAASAEPDWDSELLWGLIGRLPPPKPDLLLDRFVRGMSASEVAEKRNLPRNTVLSHWSSALQTLRSWLTGANSPMT